MAGLVPGILDLQRPNCVDAPKLVARYATGKLKKRSLLKTIMNS